MTQKIGVDSAVSCDLLIIGAGGAGLRCAAEVLEKRPETRVIALTKVTHPQKSHTAAAQGGLAAVDPEDPFDRIIYHMYDTWKGSDCMADQNVVKKICESAWEQILWLENRGMHFSRDQEGRLSKRTFGGHTVRFGEASAFRAVFEADRTGKGIIDTAWGETLKRNIKFFNQSLAVELLFREGRCTGCLVFQQKDGRFVQVWAKAVVLASGGSGQVFKVTTNCRQNTGDGLAVVLRAGMPLLDPEAVQFHPTGIVGPGILASETLRSVGGILRNKDQEPFMEGYAPKMKELAPRDLVARAIETEIREERGILNPDHNIVHVWIDLRHLPEQVHREQIPEVTNFFKRYVNLDPQKELCPVRPSNHYHMGGIPTNIAGEVLGRAQRPVPGLFAVGECAAASFHGFNRLGTNSILELITMGKAVGQRLLHWLDEEAGLVSEDDGCREMERFSRYLEAGGSGNIGHIRQALRDMMTENVGVFRTEKGILSTIESIKEFKQQAAKAALKNQNLIMNQELVQRWELDNLLDIALVISQAALQRRESRGAHFRDDYPERLDEYNHHTLASFDSAGEVVLDRRAVDMSLFKARGNDYEKFDIIERKY